IAKFCEFINRITEAKARLSLTDFIQKVYTESGYEKYLLDGTDEGQARHENVQELLTVAQKYDEYEGEEGLRLFLEEVALIADTDNIDQASEAVHMMTLHSAKGLEFQFVFIAGLEEGIMPHSRSMLDPKQMEEERRLMYVGITRAKRKVYLLFTMERNIFGSTQINPPSRFFDDIPEELVTRSVECETSSVERGAQIAKRNAGSAIRDTRYGLHDTRFKDGDRVRHPEFGDGMIVATQGDIITVAFGKIGLKKLSVSIAPLRKI
ncbi:MAG: 3'-5' exonuclease, partial [Candidatus Pacebacteria bacterium]|nr:3'-5' exonuclease [Candidatus Paceibacterota bacterium]